MSSTRLRTLLAPALLAAASAAAQGYPERPVRMVIPYPPGGTVDVVARVTGVGLAEQFGRNVIIDNRAGANGIVGSDIVSKATPDGYTLLVQASIFVINPLFLKNVPYDVQKDFTPIVGIGSVPLLVTANPGVPVANLREFIALAKAAPGKYSFATSGLGSAGHLSEEMIKRQAGIPDLLIVPYKGAGPALVDLMGGQVSAMIDPLPSSYPHVRSGRLKPIAVTSAKRVIFLPDTPTVSESGIKGFDMASWYGLWGPPGLPKPVVAKLTAETTKAARAPLAIDRLGEQGFEASGMGPEAFAKFIAVEIERYAKVVKEANIKAD
ncbi:MAG: Bug family tripartite tricarboxylate transporter substrate binding protein [Burkholderiales bacterium]